MAYKMSSSVRNITLDETLVRAKTLATKLGITRVTDTTLLDKIGIPVFASIRPGGNSLCVNAGKGFYPKEAQVGAYMEAIEYAFAEVCNSDLSHYCITIKELIEQLPVGLTLEDFNLKFQKVGSFDDKIEVTECIKVDTGATILLPSQLIFVPFHENTGIDLFGTSTNGLASGNSVEEALVHASCELMERDVATFKSIQDTSKIVTDYQCSIKLSDLRERIENANLELVLRYTDNQFGFPFFEAFILDSFDSDYLTISKGQGLHPFKEIAAIRAITEAAQSRLTHIHGGRDDIIEKHDLYHGLSKEQKIEFYNKTKSKIMEYGAPVNYSKIKELITDNWEPQGLWIKIKDHLTKCGFKDMFIAFLTNRDENLQVVKLIIPRLEFFEHKLRRVGPRLLNFMINANN